MANFSVSFIFPFFSECFQTGINNTGKNNIVQYSTCPDLSSKILETKTHKNEKLGKIVTRKNKPFYIMYGYIHVLSYLLTRNSYRLTLSSLKIFMTAFVWINDTFILENIFRLTLYSQTI